MRTIDASKLKRYETGKYKGKIDWSNNIGAKLEFTYNDIFGDIEIIDYVKAIPQGTVTVKYKGNIEQMKTNSLMKCSISKLIGRFNYDYLYNINDILNTKNNSNLLILNQIRMFHTKYYERGYTVKCLDCDHIFDIREVHITSCPNCSDRVSYPEKFVINIFSQLNEQIELQKTFKWSGLKRYDVYVPKYNMIIEVNGLIHYEPVTSYYKNILIDKYEELIIRQQNDKEKYEMALANGITNYVVIDARESNIEYMKHSILMKSDLVQYYNLDNIDWLKCHEFASKSLIKVASEMWNNNKSKEEIAECLNISTGTVWKYLKDGNELGYCIYNKHLNMSNGYKRSAKLHSKSVICLTTGEIFESLTSATKAYNIYKSGISDCCAGKISSAGKHPITGNPLKWAYYNLDSVCNI